MSTRRIIVTGGAGFIGSHVVEKLVAREDSILVIDHFATGRRDTLGSDYKGLSEGENTLPGS